MIERGRRQQSRLRVGLRCRMICRDRDVTAILTDLSQTGAKIRADVPNLRPTDLVLQWFGMEAFGTLVWADEGLCGIRFFSPIPHSWLIRTRELNEANPAWTDREATREIARQWVTGLRRV